MGMPRCALRCACLVVQDSLRVSRYVSLSVACVCDVLHVCRSMCMCVVVCLFLCVFVSMCTFLLVSGWLSVWCCVYVCVCLDVSASVCESSVTLAPRCVSVFVSLCVSLWMHLCVLGFCVCLCVFCLSLCVCLSAPRQLCACLYFSVGAACPLHVF